MANTIDNIKLNGVEFALRDTSKASKSELDTEVTSLRKAIEEMSPEEKVPETLAELNLKAGVFIADYDSSKTYALNDVVNNNGKRFYCSTAIATPEIWNEDHWTQIETTVAQDVTNLTNGVMSLNAQVEGINGEEDEDGKFKVNDENGNTGFYVDSEGAKAKSFVLTDDFGYTDKTINKDYLESVENNIETRATKTELVEVESEIPTIKVKENLNGVFDVVDENDNCGLRVDSDGVKAKAFILVENTDNEEKTIDATYLENLENKVINATEDGSGTFDISDENGHLGIQITDSGVKATSFEIVDEYGNDKFVLDSKVLMRNTRKDLRLLILGDSYSQMGYWVKGLTDAITFADVVNLGVSSASLKDGSNDRTTYPYTSRPVSSDNTTNHNTLACQIEKLKRLMAGTDLDAGEKQIYKTSDEYPNIVIIEGGQNDSADTDDVQSTYIAQFVKVVDNVYVKRNLSDTASLGTCLIKTPIDDVDRTCFGGIYRYLTEQIHTLFPDTQIFITTRSNMSYWRDDFLTGAIKIAEQQRYCADLAAVSIIDWMRDGQISSVNNHISGSGTETDPYIWGEGVGIDAPDTEDLLHPNSRGGMKLGQVAANTIVSNIINL